MFSKVFEFVHDLLGSLEGVFGDSSDGVCLCREFVAAHVECARSFHVGRITRPLDERSSTGGVLESGDELGSEVNWRFSSSVVDPSSSFEVIVVGTEGGEGIECLGSVVGTESRGEGGRAGVGGHWDAGSEDSWVSSDCCLSVRGSFRHALYPTSVSWALSRDSLGSQELLSVGCPFHLTKYCMFPCRFR